MLEGLRAESGMMVGLSTQSLNQFAASVGKAEALCAEIACILKGLRGLAVSPADADSIPAERRQVAEKAGMARRRYPVRT